MIDTEWAHGEVEAPKTKGAWIQCVILFGLCALVIAVYAGATRSGFITSSSLNPADNYYNLLVQGFRAGQLNLKIDIPLFAQLKDPYDPTAHTAYPVFDMSYYNGKFYLYFGVTPALLLFWPYVAVTGHYLPEKDAALICCIVGFLAAVGLLCALWRRYFAQVSVWVVAAGVLALGLATGTLLLLACCEVWEVPNSCGYALTMLALGTIWKALHEPGRQARWLAAASLLYGLAVGARPSLLFGAVILLVPIVHTWRRQSRIWLSLVAASGPILLIGIGLMIYNALRFVNPFDFGIRYQLSAVRQVSWQFFSPRFFWFNFRVLFLEPSRWSFRLPFAQGALIPQPPLGYGTVGGPFGVLTNVPFVWLALAAPFSMRGRVSEPAAILRAFVIALLLLFGFCALPLCFMSGANARYEVDFLPALVLLAAIGILNLECTLVSQPVWRRAARWAWSALLTFAIAFNLFAGLGRRAEAYYSFAKALQKAGQPREAVRQYEKALRLSPDFAEAHNNLGFVLAGQGETQAAIGHYEQALRAKADWPEAHNNLGAALEQEDKIEDAISQYEQALRIKPDFAEAHYNLGGALLHVGKRPEAMEHWEQALRIRPDYVGAHVNLGNALFNSGKVTEAVEHYGQAVRIKPDYAEAHNNLGVALMVLGRTHEAILHYEQALRFRPDFVEAEKNLERARASQ